MLLANTLAIDGHVDTAQRFADEGWEFTGELGAGQLSLTAARAGGLGAEFFAAWAEPVEWRGRYAKRTLQLIEGVLEQVRRHPAKLRLCVSAEEIVAAWAEEQFAVLLGVEGGHSIENDLELLRRFYALGARYMTLTWSNTNEWADSSGDKGRHGGLTEFGRAVVREMNWLGMMVDVSHVSDRTLADVLAVTCAPVIASHSSARALTDSPRNLTDEQLRAIAAGGGVVMVNFFPAFIDEAWRVAWVEQRTERLAAHAEMAAAMEGEGPVPFYASNAVDRVFAARLPRAPLASLLDHIEHVARIAGAEHVGIGSDFDGIPSLPEGMESAADLPKITAGLLARGWTAEDIGRLLGGNLLRVFTAVAARAKGLPR